MSVSLFCLYHLLFSVVIVQGVNTLLAGICFQFQDGKLFNLSCLKAKPKITEQLIQELLFPLLSVPSRNSGIGILIDLT